MHEISVGSIAEWVTAVAAFVALVFAARAARAAQRSTDAAIKLLGLEKTREDRAERREAAQDLAAARAVQADYVAAWITTLDATGVRWVVRNNSQLPIYDVRLVVVDARDNSVAVQTAVPMVPPATAWPVTTVPESPAIGTKLAALVIPLHTSGPTHRGMGAIQFRDSAGRTWHRSHVGILTEVDKPFVY